MLTTYPRWYIKKSGPDRTFAQLLQSLNTNLGSTVSSIERIRYVTSHPRIFFSDRVIESITNLDKVCDLFRILCHSCCNITKGSHASDTVSTDANTSEVIISASANTIDLYFKLSVLLFDWIVL